VNKPRITFDPKAPLGHLPNQTWLDATLKVSEDRTDPLPAIPQALCGTPEPNSERQRRCRLISWSNKQLKNI
jgi:predicted nucleic acid-binding Zn ribbon protein